MTHKHRDELIKSAIEYVEFYEKHLEYEKSKTKSLQEASNLSRKGMADEAIRILSRWDSDVRVWDYSKVRKSLVVAVKPYRKGKQ